MLGLEFVRTSLPVAGSGLGTRIPVLRTLREAGAAGHHAAAPVEVHPLPPANRWNRMR